MAGTDSMTPHSVSTDAALQFPDTSEWSASYDRKHDILTISAAPPAPAHSVDVNGEMWVVKATYSSVSAALCRNIASVARRSTARLLPP